MANCKFCGKPVTSAPVFHKDCWQGEVYELLERFCDYYCRFPNEAADEDVLHKEHCGKCPMEKLLSLGV